MCCTHEKPKPLTRAEVEALMIARQQREAYLSSVLGQGAYARMMTLADLARKMAEREPAYLPTVEFATSMEGEFIAIGAEPVTPVEPAPAMVFGGTLPVASEEKVARELVSV